MMMRARIPVEAGNAGISDGSGPAALQKVMEMVQPESAYLGTDEGGRFALIFFDLTDPSDIPAISEPLFQNMNASVEFTPVMNPAEMQAGRAKLA
ncbi:MAG: hypothetical protein DK306_001144 [Chloroflexi bacterium]|nr:MAG: hypothetical protein DK306_001144 [Chloroflexota bacterium]